MLLQKERELLAAASRELLESGLTVATGGNISLCNREENLIAITPSGMDYRKLEAADVCVLDFQGRQVDGTRVPSTETPMHMSLLAARPDDTAVVHTHSPYCTAFAILREPIPAVHYLVPLIGNEIPVAEYVTYGTDGMGPAAVHAMKSSRAALLANHGLVVAGATLEMAMNLSQIVEHIAHTYYLARSIGAPHVLSLAQLDSLRDQFSRYGQAKRATPAQR
jgi:L-fuculose-phosphate aldolase